MCIPVDMFLLLRYLIISDYILYIKVLITNSTLRGGNIDADSNIECVWVGGGLKLLPDSPQRSCSHTRTRTRTHTRTHTHTLKKKSTNSPSLTAQLTCRDPPPAYINTREHISTSNTPQRLLGGPPLISPSADSPGAKTTC